MIDKPLTYPTPRQVADADRGQLLAWCKDLPDPGESAWGEDGHAEAKRSDNEILELIFQRMRATRPPLHDWSVPVANSKKPIPTIGD